MTIKFTLNFKITLAPQVAPRLASAATLVLRLIGWL